MMMLTPFSCNKTSQQISNNSELVKQQVSAQLWAFHHADTTMNAEAAIDLLWPEYTMLVDGNRIDYNNITLGMRQFMSNISSFHTEWNDVQIIPISRDAAVTSFTFKDLIIDNSGKVTRSQGPNTFVWQKRGNQWKILYGDADHYPIARDLKPTR